MFVSGIVRRNTAKHMHENNNNTNKILVKYFYGRLLSLRKIVGKLRNLSL